MTAICILGTELAAEVQDVMIVLQVGALLLFAGVALYKVYDGTAPEGSTSRSSTGSPRSRSTAHRHSSRRC